MVEIYSYSLFSAKTVLLLHYLLLSVRFEILFWKNIRFKMCIQQISSEKRLTKKLNKDDNNTDFLCGHKELINPMLLFFTLIKIAQKPKTKKSSNN